MEELNRNQFQTVREAGDYLRLKKRTLDNMRWMGTGPSFRKHGGRIFYHKDKLKEWSLETRAKSTSQFRLTAVIATTASLSKRIRMISNEKERSCGQS